MIKNFEANLIDIEKYIIHNGTNVNNKKLQILLYFSQAWFIVINNEEINSINSFLFSDLIEAWRHGPVINCSYGRYQSNGFDTIIIHNNTESILLEHVQKFLDDVLNVYDKYSADSLESISQQEQPWKKRFVPGKQNVITHQDMFNYFSNL